MILEFKEYMTQKLFQQLDEKLIMYNQGKRYGHIFDPRTGMPAGGVYSSTVIAPTAVEADALATALYVMGPEKAAQFCDKNPEIGLIMISPGRTRQDINLQTFNLPDEKWVRLMD